MQFEPSSSAPPKAPGVPQPPAPNTVFAYGSPADKFYGRVVFGAGGAVLCYSHPNEVRWRFADGVLSFLNEAGDVTSLYTGSGNGTWTGHGAGSKWPMVLVPLITLEPNPHPSKLPPVLINSMPKSGTYLLAAALAAAGWRRVNWHLLQGEGIDDYRGLSDEEMHRNPEAIRIPCPFECIAAVLSAGDLVVGHIADHAQIAKLTRAGVKEIVLVRNLRDALVSLYRFKLRKVTPRHLGDETWRQTGEADRFIAFLSFYHNEDLAHLAEMANYILSLPAQSALRFEDLIKAHLPDWFGIRLEQIEPGLTARITGSLAQTLGRPTSTFSGGYSDWHTIWDHRAEHYFEKSGLKALNARLGYE